MGHIHDTQASLFSLMRDVEDAAAIGTLLDRQPFTSVTVAIEVAVADENHIPLFSRLLRIRGWNKHHGSKGDSYYRENNSLQGGCSPINTPTWNQGWQTGRVSPSSSDSQELSLEGPCFRDHLSPVALAAVAKRTAEGGKLFSPSPVSFGEQ